MQVLTASKIGPNRHKTAEGYLLCVGVSLARTGSQIYGPRETPVRVDPAKGYAEVHRTADQLFSDQTLQSFAGKPVIKGHPRDRAGKLIFVDPKSWKDLTVGIVLNPRQGTGENTDMLVGDLLITDADTIREIEMGNPQVSAGYDSQYREISPGVGMQHAILGNHVAIVSKARCGARCAIGDAAYESQPEHPMKSTLLERIRNAFKSRDEREFEAAMGDAAAVQTADHATGDCGGAEAMEGLRAALSEMQAANEKAHGEMRTRLGVLEQSRTGDAAAAAAQATADAAFDAQLIAEAGDKAKGAKNSKALGTVHAATVSGAEILMPGVKAPTFDEAADPKITLAAIDGLRRKTIDAAYCVPETRAQIDNALGGKPLDTAKLTADEARTLFNATVAMRKTSNNAALFTGGKKQASNETESGPAKVRTTADLNKMHAEFYAKH